MAHRSDDPFALRWLVRGLAALLVFGGLWCVWTGWKRLT
jgi:hypothetical protein